MNALELEQAAATVRASQHPAATEIADLLDHAAAELAIRENIWTQCEYPPTVQKDLTRWLYGHHIALAQALTEADA